MKQNPSIWPPLAAAFVLALLTAGTGAIAQENLNENSLKSLAGQWTVHSWNGQLNVSGLADMTKSNDTKIEFVNADGQSKVTELSEAKVGGYVAGVHQGEVALLADNERYTSGACFYPRHAVEVKSTEGKLTGYFEICFECVNFKAWEFKEDKWQPITLNPNQLNYELLAEEFAKINNLQQGSFKKWEHVTAHLDKYKSKNN